MACSPSSLDKLGTLGKCRKPRQVQGGDKEFYSLLSTSHEPSKAKMIAAPVCPSGKTAKDMTCHCSKEPAVQGIDGNSRGGCVSSPNQEWERAHGWCFLDNIRNPGNGTENCFEDTRWSVVDGRFWSNMACIDEYKKKEEERIKPGLQLLDVHTPPELLLVDAELKELQRYTAAPETRRGLLAAPKTGGGLLAAPKTGGGLLAAPKTGGGLLDVHNPPELQLLDAELKELQRITAAPKTGGGLLAAPKTEPFEKLGSDFDSEGCMSGYKWDGRYCADKRDKYCGHIPFENDIICS